MALSLKTSSTISTSASTVVETPLFHKTASASFKSRPTLRVSPVTASAVDASVCVEHHATLGVSFGASKVEIKRAYRRLARQFHPDVYKTGPSEQIFKRINLAYEDLMNRPTSGLKPAASSVSIFHSEAGDRSLEELLYGHKPAAQESYWAGAEEANESSFVDCRWLEVDELKESMDLSMFTTAAGEEAGVESAWLRC